MADEYSINAKITADSSGFEKGINKAQKASKNLSKSVSSMVQGLGKNGLVGALGAVGLASSGLSATLGSVVKIARKVSETINECTNAYKSQIIAERALDTAIQNNPFVTGESSKALKEFASEMQRVSNYGDEELIPMMANLVSLGRTESETMQIMSVAMDMSAGMGISLDSAITQLNATLNGSIGRLGQQNKELKGLTEEELKQGKAVEILGKKFKGFASATADTSKQLKNIKGDFKEVIGQFTLPSSDMWNRFWAGFYQSGIDVINRFNDYLDTQIIGKKILDNLKSNAKAVSNATGNTVEEVLSDFRYLKDQISYLSDSELHILQKTLEKQKDRSEAEERMLTIVKEITNSRKLNLDYERELAEKEAKKAQALTEQEEIENGIAELKAKHLAKIKEQEEKWKNTERVMGKAVSLEEKLKFYQEDLVAIMTEAGGQITTNNEYYKKQSAIINEILSQLGETVVETEWQKKLFDQKIEMLEAERDRAMEIAEQEGKESYTIWRDYNEKILELKLQRLEREKDEALNKEGLTEQDKIAIEEYYGNETKKIYDELGKYKKKKNEEEKKEEKNKFAIMLEYVKMYVKKYAENIKRVFSNIANTVKDVFSGIGNIAKKLLDVFKLDPDDALNALLQIEDTILTFFVETLPKLPQLFQNAVQSIVALLDTLINSINWEDVQKVLNSILDTIIENAPKIVDKLLDLVINLAQTLLDGLVHFVENGGWKMLLNCLLTIQKKLEQFVVDNIDEIVQTIIDMLPDLIQFLVDSIVSASKTLTKLIKPIIKLIMALIEAIFEFLLSEDVLEASLDVLVELIGAIAEELVPKLAYLIPKLIVKIIGFIIKELPKIIVAIVKGLIEGFAKTNWFEVIKECFIGFIDGFKDLFGIHSPSKLFEEFGGYIVEGLWNGIKDLAGWLWNNLKSFFETMFANLKNLISSAWNGLKSAFGNMGSWFQEVFGNVGNVFSNIGSGIQSAFSGLQSFFSNLFSNIGSGIQGFISSAWSSISSFASSVGSTIGSVMSNLWSSVSSTVSSVASQLYSGIQNAISSVRSALSNFGSGVRRFFGWANGTNDAPKGLALVGEQGPELIRFNGGEQVLNTRNTQKALEGAGGNTNNFNVTFNNLQDTTAFAMMNQLKQYNRQMAINGVI